MELNYLQERPEPVLRAQAILSIFSPNRRYYNETHAVLTPIPKAFPRKEMCAYGARLPRPYK